VAALGWISAGVSRAQGKGFLFVPKDAERAQAGQSGHATHLIASGGERSKSWAAEIRSTMRMVAPQTGATPQGLRLTSGRRHYPGLIFGEVAQEFKTDGQQTGASSVGEEAEVTDAHEATWQHMQKEAAQELVDGQRHRLLFVAMCGIAPSEGDVAMVERDQSVVGDGDAVGVSAEIAQGMLGSSEGALGVDDPVVAEQGA